MKCVYRGLVQEIISLAEKNQIKLIGVANTTSGHNVRSAVKSARLPDMMAVGSVGKTK